MLSEGVIGTMLRMQHSCSEEILHLALLVLLNVSCDGDEGARDMGVAIPFVENALRRGSVKVKESAAAVVFSLSLHSFHRESLLASTVVPSMVPILASGSEQGQTRLLQGPLSPSLTSQVVQDTHQRRRRWGLR